MKFRILVYFSWFVAVAATAGSLYFSEVLHLPPCILCWYQRILMYPLTLIIAVGILRKDKGLPFYVLPLSILGTGVAFYQYLLQRGILPNSIAPCTLNVPCTIKYVEYFGFVTIPFLSLLAFVIITFCMILILKKNF